MVPSGRALTRTLLLAAGLAAVVPARGDWPTYQADNQHTGRTNVTLDPNALTFAWKAPTGHGIPIVVGNTVFAMRNQQGVGSDTTDVRSFNLTTGAVHWTYTEKFVFPSHPTYAGGSLVFAAKTSISATPQLFSLNASTGALQYTVPLPGTNSTGAMPTVHTAAGGARTAFTVGSSDFGGSSVVAVSLGATSGSVLWQRDVLAFGTGSIPTVLGDSVLLIGPGKYYAFDRATGAMNHFHNGNVSGGGNATVAADPARNQFYVLESYNVGVTALTAYSYTNNSTITQLWQRSDVVGNGGAPAVGPDGRVYVANNSTLFELDPTDGHTIRSITGRSFPNSVAPILSNGRLWIYEANGFNNGVTAFDLTGANITAVRQFTGGRGHLNTSFDGPGVVGDGYLIVDYGNIYNQPGFDVYVVPEPSGLLALAGVGVGLVGLARRRLGRRGN